MTATQAREDVLVRPLERLEEALANKFPGHECEWLETVTTILGNIEQSLRSHGAAVESADGLLAKVDLTRPTLTRQVSELRREHRELLQQAHALQLQLQTAAQAFDTKAESVTDSTSLPKPAGGTAVPDFGLLRQDAQKLLGALHRHLDDEAKLILESVNTDIGVGD
jgi:hypothetical protein